MARITSHEDGDGDGDDPENKFQLNLDREEILDDDPEISRTMTMPTVTTTGNTHNQHNVIAPVGMPAISISPRSKSKSNSVSPRDRADNKPPGSPHMFKSVPSNTTTITNTSTNTNTLPLSLSRQQSAKSPSCDSEKERYAAHAYANINMHTQIQTNTSQTRRSSNTLTKKATTLAFNSSLNGLANQHSLSKSHGTNGHRNSDIIPSAPSLRQRKSIRIAKFNKQNKELLDQHQLSLIDTAVRYTVLSSVAFSTSLLSTLLIGM